MTATTELDLYAAGAVILAALVAFIAVLYLNAQPSKAGARGAGTKMVQENGQTVRRSTRQARAD
jgi:hypothetical protein